jgi:hypothetical protein
MGSPLSPILADLFMEELEQKGLSTYNNGPRVWWRYVDVFLIWNMNSGDIEEFHNHINSLNPAIKFTKEIEEENTLPFLDVEIMKRPNGDLETSM